MIFWFTQMDAIGGFYVVAALFGLAYGGVVPCYAFIVRELIPAHRAGWATGTVFFFGNIGMGVGGFLGGWLFDVTGTYAASFGAGAAFGTFNLLVVGFLLYQQKGHRLASAMHPAA